MNYSPRSRVGGVAEAVLKGHEKGVLSLKLLGDMLYAGDRKGEIKLWKVGEGEDVKRGGVEQSGPSKYHHRHDDFINDVFYQLDLLCNHKLTVNSDMVCYVLGFAIKSVAGTSRKLLAMKGKNLFQQARLAM